MGFATIAEQQSRWIISLEFLLLCLLGCMLLIPFESLLFIQSVIKSPSHKIMANPNLTELLRKKLKVKFRKRVSMFTTSKKTKAIPVQFVCLTINICVRSSLVIN